MFKKNVIIFCVCLMPIFSRLVSADMKNLKDENIEVELQLISGESLFRLAPTFNESIRAQKYVVGKITNLYDRKATMQITVKSPGNSSIFIESLNISWIPPKSSAYFVYYLGSPILDTEESDIRLEYEIIQKMIK